MGVAELVLRISIGFIVLFTLARIMGRKEIGQITFFNFISAIAIGSITANLVVSNNLSIRNGVIALVGWTIYTLVMDFIGINSKNVRKITTGDPVIVIKEGKIVERAMRKTRLDLDSLNAMLRQQSIFSMNNVDFAIFESNGKLSVMKKEQKQSLTKGDMNIAGKQKIYPIPTEIISDGKIVKSNLPKLNITQPWIEQQLKNSGVHSIADVFYAEVQEDGSLFIDSKENLLH